MHVYVYVNSRPIGLREKAQSCHFVVTFPKYLNFRACKSHKNKLSNKGDCSRCNGAPAETYKEVVMSIYVMESSEEVKTVKVFSEALPVEMRGTTPEEIGEELDGKNVSAHCVGEKDASYVTTNLLQLK